jgi:hypothetical protein
VHDWQTDRRDVQPLHAKVKWEWEGKSPHWARSR